MNHTAPRPGSPTRTAGHNNVTTQPLLTPYRMRDLELHNRVVMAPLTRMRASNPGLIPTELHAEYYAQRATAGLIVTEGIFVSPASVGWARVPGLWTREQVRGWQGVTGAVHDRGGRIFAQLWHTGSLSHPDFHDGSPPLAPSAVNPRQQSVTRDGHKDTVEPRGMTRDDQSSYRRVRRIHREPSTLPLRGPRRDCGAC
jgi:N-ethylmaleimide reductase